MSHSRADRVGRELYRHLALALVEFVRQGKRVAITRVKVTDNLQTLRAWMQGWDGLSEDERKYLHRSLCRAITEGSQTKFTPRLVILNDDSVDYAEHIDKLLREENS